MLNVLAITGPIYIAIAVGFAAVRFELFSKADMHVLGKFVIDVALPALLFRALATHRIAEILNPTYMLAYALGSLAVIGASRFVSRRLAHLDAQTSTFIAMGMSCSNSGFVGYPILLLTLAPVAGVVLALNMVVENIVVIPLLLALAEHGRGGAAAGPWHSVVRHTLRRLAKNPLILAIVAGLAVSLFDWTPPEPVDRAIQMFALASGAASLFVIGGTLVGLSVGSVWRRALPIAAGKLLLHPLAVLLAVLAVPLLGLPPLHATLRTAAVLSAAMPMFGIYPILAQVYGHERFAAPALLVTTAAAFFSLSGILWALGRFQL